MHPTVRLAGYFARTAALAECGARLRTEKEDEDWTEEENAEWDRLCDEIEPWFYALSDAEREFLCGQKFDDFLGKLTRGEDML